MTKRVTKKLWRATFNDDTAFTATVNHAAALFGVRNPGVPAGFALLGWTWEVKHDNGSYGIVTLVYPDQRVDHNLRSMIPARMRPVFVAKEPDHG